MIENKKSVVSENRPDSSQSLQSGYAENGCAVVPIHGKGRGVVAQRDFAAGEVFERAPVIIVPASESEKMLGTTLDHYWYEWDDDGSCAVAGGCGSFYNHSFDPNIDFDRDFSNQELIYIALRQIRAGEEATINYNGVLGCLDPVHFEVR